MSAHRVVQRDDKRVACRKAMQRPADGDERAEQREDEERGCNNKLARQEDERVAHQREDDERQCNNQLMRP
jgi:hypothetical protein